MSDLREYIPAVLGREAARTDELAEKIAERLVAAGLTTNQVRNFYGPFAKIRARGEGAGRRAALLAHRARVAYLVARSEGRAEALWEVFGELLRRAQTPIEIDAVCDLAEPVVSYHRFHLATRRKESR